MMPDWLMQILGMAFAAAGIYGAIRSDLGEIREKAEGAANSAEKAHSRIDELLLNHHRRAGDVD